MPFKFLFYRVQKNEKIVHFVLKSCTFRFCGYIRKFVVSNCSSEVCMAKVGLENDTLKPSKCPSNWEYSTGKCNCLIYRIESRWINSRFPLQVKVSES